MKHKKLSVENLELSSKIKAMEDIWFVGDFGEDVNNEISKNSFFVEDVGKVKDLLQDANYLYFYYVNDYVKLRAAKEDIIIDENRVYINKWEFI